MTDSDATIISSAHRCPITAQRRQDGGIALRAPSSLILLDREELARLIAFASDKPQLGQLRRYPVSAPPSDELNFIE